MRHIRPVDIPCRVGVDVVGLLESAAAGQELAFKGEDATAGTVGVIDLMFALPADSEDGLERPGDHTPDEG